MCTIFQYVLLSIIFLLLPLLLAVVGCLLGLVVQYALIKIAYVMAKEKYNENKADSRT